MGATNSRSRRVHAVSANTSRPNPGRMDWNGKAIDEAAADTSHTVTRGIITSPVLLGPKQPHLTFGTTATNARRESTGACAIMHATATPRSRDGSLPSNKSNVHDENLSEMFTALR